MKIIKLIARFFKSLFPAKPHALAARKQIEDIMIHSMSLEARVRSLSILVNKQSQLLSDIAKVQSEIAMSVFGPPAIESMLGLDIEIFDSDLEDFDLETSIPLILISNDDDDDLIN
jgi:hypothetical protein